MHINEKTSIEIRRHSAPFYKRVGMRADGVDIHAMDWKQLSDTRAECLRAATATIDKMKDDMGETEFRSIEAAYEGIMEIFEEVEAEKDYRTSIGKRDARDVESRSADRRPISNVRRAYSGVGDGMDDDGDETRDGVVETFALRSGQSMADYLLRQRPDLARENRGVSEGAYLRAMVTGPKNEAERRALNEGSDSAGGYTVPDILSARMIDRMRAASVVFRAGAQVVPLASDKTSIAKVATDPVPGWRNENAAVAESEPTFANVSLTPHSLMVMVRVSREVLEDSLNIDSALPQIIAEAMASEVDRAALLGTGTSPEPLGVRNFTGLTVSNNTVGNLVDWKPFITVRTALRTVDSDVTAFIMHPSFEGRVAGLVDSTGQPLRMPPALETTPMMTTTKIPTNLGAGTNESIILAGDWRRLLVGMRYSLRIEVLKERYADLHQYAFVAHLRADVSTAE